MRLAVFERDGAEHAGIVLGTGSDAMVVDVEAAVGLSQGYSRTWSVTDILAAPIEERRSLAQLARRALEDLDGPAAGAAFSRLSEASLLPPIGRRQLIVCCGLNYTEHAEEMGESVSVRGNSARGDDLGPTWFIKNANGLVGSGADIVLPPDEPDVVDFEGELAVVFSRRCHRVSAAAALDHIGGYTLVNDVSARRPVGDLNGDVQRAKRSVIQSHLGKQHPTFCPIGPVVTTADEIPDPDVLEFSTTLNGERVQTARLSDMRLGVRQLVEWLSRTFTFAPGDIISTGSPGGTGVSHDPPRFLRPGDVVTVSMTEIGDLRNQVRAPDQLRVPTATATTTEG